MKVNIKKILLQEFESQEFSKTKGYLTYMIAERKSDELTNQLSDGLKEEFNQYKELYTDYECIRFEEFIEFVLDFIKSFFS